MTVGYDTILRGELVIEPPLRYGEYKDSPHNGQQRAQENKLGVYLAEDRETVETDDGVLDVRTAGRVVYAWPRAEKLYDIVPELQRLVDAHPGHAFTGEFRAEGDDFGDIWLLRVNADRKVERVLPTITWPDGTVLRNERYE